jgi:phenylalanyl-tRNA synthetase beta chain
MKISYNYLAKYLDLSAAELAEKLTARGLEVEEIATSGGGFYISEIVSAKPHPNAATLQVCEVKTYDGIRQIVCGAKNARAGIKVVMADIGAVIPNGGLVIKKSKIRDVESCGMLCSLEELGLADESEGILELDGGEVGLTYGSSDSILDINITPNRGDCLSLYGLLRDLGVGQKTNLPANTCSFASLNISGVNNLAATPSYIKDALAGSGISSISPLVDISNFVMLEMGHPNHIYDNDKLDGDLRIKQAEAGELFNSLKDIEYKLPQGSLVVADNSKIVALGGVIGGSNSSTSSETKNITIEVAYFDSDAVAILGRKLNINTDSRYRFERGLDALDYLAVINRIADLVIEICGGTKGEIKLQNEAPYTPRVVDFNPAFIETKLGIAVANWQEILTSLGFAISGNKITIPSWRNDVKIAEDLVEEIARIYGYDNIPQLPFTLPQAKKNKTPNLHTLLAGLGRKEHISLSFADKKVADIFCTKTLELANPISSDLAVMRPTLLCGLLGKTNNFEIGKIFGKDSEEMTAATIQSGKVYAPNHYGNRLADCFDAKADAFAIISQYTNTDGIQLTTDNLPDFLHPAKSALLQQGKTTLGYFGELHPAITKTQTAVCEIYIDRLPQPKYKKPSKYEANNLPLVERDFSFNKPANIAASELIKAVKMADRKFIKDASIFDVYNDSIAIKVILKPIDKTFTSEEIEKISASIIQNVAAKTSATLK